MIEGPKNAPPAHAERAEPEMEQGALSCPSCRAQGQRHWGRRDGHDMWACTECGLVYFPRPIVQTYDYQDYYPYLRGFDEPRIKWELAVRRSKYVGQLKIIRRNAPQASTLLDVGAGPGYFTRVANECGFSARGVEPSLEARRAGRDHYGVSYVELDEVQDDSIDVLTCHHVLEHVEWPQDFLALLRRKLKKGGLLVLHVPNQQPMSFRLRQILSGGRGDTHCSLYYPIHVNGFTSRSLVATSVPWLRLPAPSRAS